MRPCILCAVLAAVSTSTIAASLAHHLTPKLSTPSPASSFQPTIARLIITPQYDNRTPGRQQSPEAECHTPQIHPPPESIPTFPYLHLNPTSAQGHPSFSVTRPQTHSTSHPVLSSKPPLVQSSKSPAVQSSKSPPVGPPTPPPDEPQAPFSNRNVDQIQAPGGHTNNENTLDPSGHCTSQSPSSQNPKASRRVTQWLKNLFLKIWAPVVRKLQQWYASSKRTKARQKSWNKKQDPKILQETIQTDTPSNSIGDGPKSVNDDNQESEVKSSMGRLLSFKIDPSRTRWLRHVSMGIFPKFLYSWITHRLPDPGRPGIFGYISYLYRSLFNREKALPLDDATKHNTNTQKADQVSGKKKLDPVLASPEANRNSNERILVSPGDQVPVRKKLEPQFIPESREGELIQRLVDLVDTEAIAVCFRDILMNCGLRVKALTILSGVNSIQYFLDAVIAKAATTAEAQLRKLQIDEDALDPLLKLADRMKSGSSGISTPQDTTPLKSNLRRNQFAPNSRKLGRIGSLPNLWFANKRKSTPTS